MNMFFQFFSQLCGITNVQKVSQTLRMPISTYFAMFMPLVKN